MKALPGLSQAPCDHRLSVFRDLSRATQQQTYAEGVASGTRRRHPGGGSTGKRPTRAEPLPGGRSDDQTAPPWDVLGTPCAMARSTAHANLPKLAPILSD